MGIYDDVETVTDIALGKAQDQVWKMLQDTGGGAVRFRESVNFFDINRQVEIGYENEALAGLLAKTLTTGYKTAANPLNLLIVIIAGGFVANLPDGVALQYAKKMGISIVGKKIGKALGKAIALKVAEQITLRLVATQAFRTFAGRIGLSVGAGSTGVGIPIAVLMSLGLFHRASRSSKRLEQSHPAIFNKLRFSNMIGNLDLLYFIVEEPLEPIMKGISHLNSYDRAAYVDALVKKMED